MRKSRSRSRSRSFPTPRSWVVASKFTQLAQLAKELSIPVIELPLVKTDHTGMGMSLINPDTLIITEDVIDIREMPICG